MNMPRPNDDEIISLCHHLIQQRFFSRRLDDEVDDAVELQDWGDDEGMVAAHSVITIMEDPFEVWLDIEVNWDNTVTDDDTVGHVGGYIRVMIHDDLELHRVDYDYDPDTKTWEEAAYA